MTYFAYARTALKFGVLRIGLKKGDVILLPNYICDVFLHPIRNLGLRVFYYPVTDSFEPRWDVLEQLVGNQRFQAIVMVHFFGQPQEIQRYKKLCDLHKMILIEDNAHGFGGRSLGKILGTYGDIGISSPRKILNIGSGGVLYVNGIEDTFSAKKLRKKSCSFYFIRKIIGKYPIIKKHLYRGFGLLPNFNDINHFKEDEVSDMAADSLSQKYIEFNTDSKYLDLNSRVRRVRWRFWSRISRKIGLVPVYSDVNPESCPWAFPVYARTVNEREAFAKLCLNFGVIAFPWPSLPDELRIDRESHRRWNELICVPLDIRPKRSIQ